MEIKTISTYEQESNPDNLVGSLQVISNIRKDMCHGITIRNNLFDQCYRSTGTKAPSLKSELLTLQCYQQERFMVAVTKLQKDLKGSEIIEDGEI